MNQNRGTDPQISWQRRRQARRGLSVAALVMTALAAAVVLVARHAPPARADQSAGQTVAQQAIKTRPPAGTRVTFVVTQGSEAFGRSKDQITIVFSDRSWRGAVPPSPLFGEDILQEFSFSATDFDKRNMLTFSRIVRDQTFLGAKFVRVINHGDEGWAGGTLSIAIDGQPLFGQERVSMLPRTGDPTKGIQDWNRYQWRNRTYWEAELDQLRQLRRKY